MNKIEELRWIRVFTPDHVPRYLIEQVRDRDYSVEEFFQYHQINCLTQSNKELTLNPFSHLYVLADKENMIKGVLWFSIDPLSKDILIQTFSVDKEYWGKGLAVKMLAEHIKKIRKKGNLNKIYWVTNYPKHSERYDFKRSKAVLMEYDPKKQDIGGNNGKNDDGKHNPRGEHRVVNTRTTGVSEQCNGGTGTDGAATRPATVPTNVSTVVH